MGWAAPWAFALLALVPLVLLLHSLRLRRREVRISAVYLWEELLRERRSTLGMSKLLRSLLLLLQVLGIAALTFGLADPFARLPSTKEGDIVLVLDASASMRSTSKGEERFARAREVALDLVQRLHPNSEMAIIYANSRPTLKVPFTADRTLLKQTLEGFSASDEPGDLAKAVHLGRSLLAGGRTGEVLVLSDGSDPQLPAVLAGDQQVRALSVAGGERNVGITKFEVRPRMNRPGEYEILVNVANFSRQPESFELVLSLNWKTLRRTHYTFAAGEHQSLIFPYTGAANGVAEVVLELNDDLSVDNRAATVLSDRPPVWILLASRGNYFLESVLAGHANASVNVVSSVSPSSFEQQVRGNHIVILDGLEPPPLLFGNFLLINTTAPNLPITVKGSADAPPVVDWDTTDPILRSVQLRDLQVRRSQIVEVGEGVKPLLYANGSPLLSTVETGRLRAVHLGFDLLDSDLPLRVAFPVLMANILEWLSPQHGMFVSHQVQAGEPYLIELDGITPEVSVRKPTGDWVKVSVTENPLAFRDTSQVGIYTVRVGKKTQRFAVNLVSREESEILPEPVEPKADAPFVVGSSTQESVKQPLWPYFVMLAFGLTLVEWYFWCRTGS
ncbi:MAG TPA: VWA domain-containing protein [Candidatus Tectomicrobia bacterium]|nr:VWA domain-containing protein [Candidatus Tectomicrobia bacterium]